MNDQSPPLPSRPASRPWSKRFRNVRVLEVKAVRNVSPRMRRVTLGGAEFEGIPDGSVIKLLIPPPGVREDCWPAKGPRGEAVWPPDERRPIVRTYTARHIDRVRGEMEIDFVRHGAHGVASDWAERAQPGDVIGIGGPGGLHVRPANWYLFVGDETALPGIARALEVLPADAKGHALIEVADAADEQPLSSPPGIRIAWLYRNGVAPGKSDALIEAVKGLAWPQDGDVFVWVGTESRTARALKSYVRDERGIDRRRFLVIGYWKLGMSEGEYHEAHDHDRGEDYHAVSRETHGS